MAEIDSLFGSKTRVKLLYLFLNNPEKSFYVREITRLIGEQINSVRRELSNMTEIGIVSSDSSDNKLYYKTNSGFRYYHPLSEMFSKDPKSAASGTRAVTADLIERAATTQHSDVVDLIAKQLAKLARNVQVAVVAGSLVDGSAAQVDLLVAGDMAEKRSVERLVAKVEDALGREIRFTILSYDEMYYRVSVRDRFVEDVLRSQHIVLVDKNDILGVN